MAIRKVVELWTTRGAKNGAGVVTNLVETHGGENAQSARRVFSARTGKYAPLMGDEWLTALSFGFFFSGNPADAVIGGGIPGKAIDHDYVCGMPNALTAHWHCVDVRGYDRMMIYLTNRCALYEGLALTGAAGPLNLDLYYADEFMVASIGLPVSLQDIREFNLEPPETFGEFARFPPALLRKMGIPTSGEGGAGLGVLRPMRLSPLVPPTTTDEDEKDNFYGAVTTALFCTGAAMSFPGAGTPGGHSLGSSTNAQALTRPFPTRHLGWPDQEWPIQSVARGALQVGKVRTGGGGLAIPEGAGADLGECRLPQTDDHHAIIVRTGYDDMQWPLFDGSGVSTPVYRMDLRITGLAQVLLQMVSLAIPWGIAPSGPNPATMIASAFVPPATSPRQHVEGRIWAILSKDR